MNVVAPARAVTCEPQALDRYLADDEWVVEPKVDGVRSLVHVEDGLVRPISRTAKPLDLPPVVAAFARFAATPGRWVLDGEWVRSGHKVGTYWLFDLIEAPPEAIDSLLHDYPGGPLAGRPLTERRLALERLYAAAQLPDTVKLLPQARSTAEKTALVERIRTEGGEGVILKKATAPYRAGQNRNQLKVKFRNDLDAVVTAVRLDGKSNLRLGVYDGDELVCIGECGALSGGGKEALARFDAGEEVVVTVIYQYAFQDPVTGRRRLIMPTFPIVRLDKSARECLASQLVFSNKAAGL